MRKPVTIYKEIEEWLEDPSNKRLLHDRPLNKLDEYLEDERTTSNAGRSASQLGHISIWHKNNFLKRLWNNDDQADESGALMLDYEFWRLRIFSARYPYVIVDNPDFSYKISYFEAYPFYCLLLMFGRLEQARWLGAKLHVHKEPGAFEGWHNDRAYGGFVLRMHCLMSGMEMEDELPDCGVYQGLFTHWNETSALEQSLLEVCNEYDLRTQHKMEKKFGILEFDSRPYDVLPVSVLSYRKLRSSMGLETPLPSHPLLESQFVANLPEEIEPTMDETMSRVISAASELWPSVLTPLNEDI